MQQSEFEAGRASMQATAATAAPLGLIKVLGNIPADNATVVLLNQTAALDVHMVSDKGYVTAAGGSHALSLLGLVNARGQACESCQHQAVAQETKHVTQFVYACMWLPVSLPGSTCGTAVLQVML